MVTRPAGRVSGIRGRVVLATAGIALGLGAAVAGVTGQGALPADSGSHLRLGDVGWNVANQHVVAGDGDDVGWNGPQPGTTPTPTPSSGDDVGWN
ncbi:hypothetical protein ACFY7H_29125 [Streptomyces sp. NPDC012794]|uniref:hypothetical protein n=1 Tax=Streptomyces sp. NPDC012794 TaxID=3364850 RepID=UPI0036C274C7